MMFPGINKALEKDRDLRYQHASDMRADLRRQKKETESGKAAAGVAAAWERGNRRFCNRRPCA